MGVLVTGASGFIGRHLVARLSREGAAVVGLLHRTALTMDWPAGVDTIVGDVRDASAMKAAVVGCDTVYHLAGTVHAGDDDYDTEQGCYATNVEGTRNLLAGAVEAGVRRFVFFSSVKAMGEGGTSCLDESADHKPVTAYGRSRLAAEHLVLDFCNRNGLHGVCLRLPLVYGPGNKGNLVRMIAAVERGVFPSLPETGNRRSMVYVGNVVEAAILAAKNPRANLNRFIVTDCESYSTRELYELICRGLGKRVPRWCVPIWALKSMARIGDAIGRVRGRRLLFDSDALEKLIGSAWFSCEKISRELGYRPSRTFEEALPELIAWYRKSRA